MTKNICEVYGVNGYIRTSYSYTPFGVVSSTGDVEQPIQWSSEVYDKEMRLVYYNYRYHNPIAGKWTNRDFIERQNPYSYQNNNVFINDYLGLTEYMPGASPGTAVPPSAYEQPREKATKYISPNSLDDNMEYAIMSFALRRFASDLMLIYPAGGRFSEYLWNHHEEFKDWKEYFELMQLQCKYEPDKENPRIFKTEKLIYYIAPASDFFRDILSLIIPYRVNHYHHDYFAPELIGSFGYNLTSELDCCKKTKKLSIEVMNSLSTASLTRNPFTREPILESELFNTLHTKIMIQKEEKF